ncbi:MAG: hypothetical protein JF593_09820 [Novosphingobium sp.]|nr:hypothetical protein [Novosphingobium sp.]
MLGGAALALTSVWALAQENPESLLPPGFDRPPPRERRAEPPPSSPEPSRRSDGRPTVISRPVVQPLPGHGLGTAATGGGIRAKLPANLPSLEKLEAMSPDQLDELFGLKPKADIPPNMGRALEHVGVLASDEGGFSAGGLTNQDPTLVQALLNGNKGMLVSRWGHILLRRALASRLDAPAGMDPADFAAARASLLVRMGEGDAARALVQDVDTANYTPALTQAAIDAYLATADVTGVCPMVTLLGSTRQDAQWQVLRGICTTYSGDSTSGMAQLDRAFYYGILPRVDLLLAQKYAGAFGKTRRAVKIEWDKVDDMNPFRFALTIGTGLEPPAKIMESADPRYHLLIATAPMLGLGIRANAADEAGAAGVLSSAAMVDLYSQIYADAEVAQEWQDRANQLHDAYLAADDAARLNAMQQLWNGADDPEERYARQVLTAYAAARLPVSNDMADAAPDLVASMLAAGLDRNALRWAPVAQIGTLSWAQLVLAEPSRATGISSGAIDTFRNGDKSDGKHKSALLVAALAGLGRITPATRGDAGGKLGIDLDRSTNWTRLIDQAAAAHNPEMVALLAALGMQGDTWDKMTARYLYHIVGALDRVGLGAEARMIAAEAVARA